MTMQSGIEIPAQASGGTIPVGAILMWSGLLASIPAGWNLRDGTLGTPDLRSRFIKGAAAGIDPGVTGGAATHTHDNHPALVHAGSAVADHAALVHAGTAVTAHPSHTHTYSQVPNHVHVENVASSASGGLVGSTPDTSTNTSVASGYSTANPTGGVAQGTTDGPSASLTHSVTQPDNHAVQVHGVTQPNNHAISAHGVTQPNDHAAQAHVAANSEPSFFSLVFIMKAA